MIISVSRRTDIPAFYSDWFINRIKEGYVLVRNPMNYYQVSKVSLKLDVVDCIVFWSKNPANMIPKLSELNQYKYYFQFTLNSYGKDIEPNVPRKSEVINTFITLSKIIGKEKVIWRYDPIFLTDKITKEYHYKYFEYLVDKLHGYTEKCVISFLDIYKKTERNMKKISLKELKEDDMKDIVYNLSSIAKKYDIKLETCSEELDLSEFGIGHNKCIDDKLISRILKTEIRIEKDKNQREICGCVSSIDIGAYNTCNHKCLYCYANFNKTSVQSSIEKHIETSPFLIGQLQEEDKITERKMESFTEKFQQESFL